MPINDNLNDPLYIVIGRIAGIWTIINIGYYLVIPSFGFDLSYNSSPFVISAYWLLWVFIIIFYFWDIYSRWLKIDSKIWFYVLQSLGAVSLFLILIYIFSELPNLKSLTPSKYPDLLFASSLYFLPKSVEVLVQQLLITVLVADLSFRLESLKNVVIGYAICFGGAHIALFFLDNSSIPYSLLMTIAAFLSSLIFPYLILRVKGGFTYAYMIHFLFYIILAIFLHTLLPPGYVV